VTVDVRVLVATHRNLEELVRQGKFRQDLFHRIYVFPLWLPALRDRPEDIRVLVEHFGAQICAQNNWKSVAFTNAALAALERYAWPGNVRELRNMVERLMLLAGEDEIGVEAVNAVLAPTAGGPGWSQAGSGTLAERVADFEREVLLSELKRANFHMTNAAKTLGLERSHLYKKAEQLGIDIRKARQEEVS
jgi:DNA-binding NtrC family response regulator